MDKDKERQYWMELQLSEANANLMAAATEVTDAVAGLCSIDQSWMSDELRSEMLAAQGRLALKFIDASRMLINNAKPDSK